MKITLILIFFKIYFLSQVNSKDCNFMYSHSRIGTCETTSNICESAVLEFKYFSHFNQFDLNCYENNSNIILTSLEFYPNWKLILDSSLKFTSSKINFYLYPNFKFLDLSGFDSDSSVFSTFKTESISLNIFFSELRLYKNSKLYYECQDSISIQGPLKNINSISFAFSVKYFQNTCPLIFKNTQIDNIWFYGFSEIFLKNNMLGFNLDQNFENLNSSINTFIIHLYKAKISKKLLNKFVFKNTKTINLLGILKDIEPDAFDQIPNTNLILGILNFDSIIKENILDRFPKNQKFFLTLQISYSYSYPNEDICYFRNISSYLNICILPPYGGLKCTCAILWILKLNSSNTCNSLTNFFVLK